VSGFDSPGLRELFHPSDKSTSSTSKPSGTHTQSSTSSTSTVEPVTSGVAAGSTKKNATPVSAIAGGIIGGLLGLAALLSLVLFLLRRHKQKSKYEVTEMGDSPVGGSFALNLDGHPVYEKNGSHVLASELPVSRDSKSEVGSASPAELYGDHAVEMGVPNEMHREHASLSSPVSRDTDMQE
jgi:hypothetical protein